MKCDELIPTQIYAQYAETVYDDFGESRQEQEYYRKEHADAAIAELKQKLESVQASMYCDVVDANMENRKLKRALWLAREWRAWCEGQFYLALESDRPRDIYHLICTKRIHRTPNEWTNYWQNVEQLCEKKAEEYK